MSDQLTEPRVPPHLAACLVEALGAYLRATPAQKLPTRLRPIKSFTKAALQRHKAEVLSLLEEESGRALILEWLKEGRPALERSLQEKLELAARHEVGWVEKAMYLDGGASKVKEKKPRIAPVPDERVAKLRDELKLQRTRSREELEAERGRGRELAAEVRSLRSQLQEAQRRVQALDASAAKDVAALQASSKKAKREADRATAEAGAALEKLSATRKDLAAAKRRATEAEAVLARTSAPPRPRAETEVRPPKGPRRVLKAPGGRLDDDPETLKAWLLQKGVHLFVDGYNVVLRTSPGADLSAKRDLLIDDLQRLARTVGVPTTVVFDGDVVPPGTRRRRLASVRVEYSKPDEIADDHLIARLQELPAFPAVLVTDDKELRDRAAALGATVAGSNQLLALLGRTI